METPSQWVSNLLHFVTQWMSVVMAVRGRASISSHVQFPRVSPS